MWENPDDPYGPWLDYDPKEMRLRQPYRPVDRDWRDKNMGMEDRGDGVSEVDRNGDFLALELGARDAIYLYCRLSCSYT